MLRRLRLISGLVLFIFVSTHLLNHVAGLVSLEYLEAGRRIFLLLWRNPLGTGLLYLAFVVHLGLAFYAIYRRRTLRMPGWEAAQLLLGLALPPLLFLHLLGTRLSHEVLGTDDSYTLILLIYFVFLPIQGFKQVAIVLIAWLHGCVGLHYWLRMKPWYGAAQPYLIAVGTLFPALSLFGFWMSGRAVQHLAEDKDWLDRALAEARMPSPDKVQWIYNLENGLLIAFAVAIAATLAGRYLRALIVHRRGMVQIYYPENKKTSVPLGTSVLEASRLAGIPHAAVCGGRGRCSTCRVRIGDGFKDMEQPDAEERRVLVRVGAAENVRLACQLRPSADCEVYPLLPPGATPREARARPGYLQGQEQEIAILFADLRGFTSLSEERLPYDVVFILNRYFAAMGEAVEEAGGQVDKFIGDGVMALFGIGKGIEAGSCDALNAARLMADKLEGLNKTLASDLRTPLRIGIGIHSGPAIVGEMGYAKATSVTAVGDTVNTASRLEAMTKDFSAQLVVSGPLAGHAGLDLSAFPEHEIEVRGRASRMAIRVIEDARALPN